MKARLQHAALAAQPRSASLSAGWTPVGPAQVANPIYGNVTGRVTSIVLDPADPGNNTVYVGTTGGGVWKSINAAGPAAEVRFAPMTDTLPVFSAGAGSSAIASLSIGALAMGNGVLLAGTGDPNDATDSYYGSGILRSTDGGVTWTLASQAAVGSNGNVSFAGMSVAGLAFSTASPSVVVAAISQSVEGALVEATNPSYTVPGLFVSSDAGQTWQLSTVMDGAETVQQGAYLGGSYSAATSVVWNPVRQRFYAAMRFHGYYESANGLNWTRLLNQPAMGMTLQNCPTFGPNPACPLFRGALAVQPASGDTFALTIDATNQDAGLYQDVCALAAGGVCATSAPTFASKLDSTPLEVGGGSAEILQGDYNLVLAAVPSGADTLLYAGTIDLYRCSLASGCVLRNTTNAQNGCATPAGVAGAQHAIAATESLGFFGNDGGLWRSTDGVAEAGGVCSATDADHFDNLNGGIGSLAEVVTFAQDPVQAGTLLAGLGALGSAGTGAAGSGSAWTQMSTGEGGTVAIDQISPQNWYVATGPGVNIGFCGKGATCGLQGFAATVIGANEVQGDPSLTDAPWMLDPQDSGELLAGTCRVRRGPAAGGVGWSTDLLSAPFGEPLAAGCSGSGFVRSQAAGGPLQASGDAPNAGSEVLYAGLAAGQAGVAGHLFTSGAANVASSVTVWTDVGISPVTNAASADFRFNPGGFDISSVAVDPHDASGGTVYATVMGFAGTGANAAHLYRSADFGAHWLNVSSNLPNAPANSVVVDPNDANTVYVALDTGVYVTQQVTGCASSPCWSVYGTALPNAPVLSLAAAAGMMTGDGRTGELRAGTYGRGIWQIPLLTALSPAAPAMSLSSQSLTFASIPVGSQSAAQTLVVTNTGSATLTVTSVVASSGFSASSTCPAAIIPVAGTCSVVVQFTPSGAGSLTGLLTIYGNVTGGQATATLSGVATAAVNVVLAPTMLSFPSTPVGTSSAAQNVTISNTGAALVNLQSVAASGDFSITANTCDGSLAPAIGCTVTITFKPLANGARSGTLSVTDDAGVQVAQLAGTGTSAATDALSPLTLSFAPQQVSTASAAMPVTLTNTGDEALTLIAAVLSGDFSVIDGCGATLPGRASCAILVSYAPKSVGSEAGLLTVTDEFRSQTVTLTGTGFAPPGVSLSPAGGLSFAPTAVGQTSAAQTVTLTNSGGAALTISSVEATGDFVVAANTCGTSLAAGATCTLQITFSPTAGGVRTGLLTLTDSAGSSPQTLPLTGAGVDFALAVDGAASLSLASGQTANYLLLLTSTPGVPGSAAFTCSGVPAAAVCSVNPAGPPLYASGGTVITVTVATGQTHAGLVTVPIGADGTRGLVWLGVAVPLGLFARRRMRRAVLASAVLIALMALAACGTVGRTIPGDGGGGGSHPPPMTPSGTYTLQVAGSSAGLTRTLNLTLVIE